MSSTALTLRHAAVANRSRSSALAIDAALAVGGAAFMALCAQISFNVPWTPVPYTLQTFGMLIVGASMGWLVGGASMLLYAAVGAVGAPVFADQAAGWDEIVGATGGYIVGFIVSALVLGYLADRGWGQRFSTSVTGMLTGLVITFGIGVPWLAASLDVSVTKALEFGLYPFVPGEIIKLYLAGALIPGALHLVSRIRARGAGV